MVGIFSRLGIEARMPGELMFLENFYKTQTLSSRRLQKSSYKEPNPEVTVYSKLPDMIEYYLTRWEHLNLIAQFNQELFDPSLRAEAFENQPRELLAAIERDCTNPYPGFTE